MALRLPTFGNRAEAAAEMEPGPGPLVSMRDVHKVFQTGRLEFPALRGVDIDVDAGDLVAIVGPSGSGKSTILNIMTGIDRPTSGTVTFAGRRTDDLDEEQLALWRGKNVGIVFQFFQLLPMLNAMENAMLPLEFAGHGTAAERVARATAKLELVGLGGKLDHLPMELSGGEQQRVAIARALACEPRLLVADEPTGNLDSDTAGQVIDLLTSLNGDGMTIVYVTHDPALAGYADRVVSIRDGLVIEDGAYSWRPQ